MFDFALGFDVTRSTSADFSGAISLGCSTICTGFTVTGSGSTLFLSMLIGGDCAAIGLYLSSSANNGGDSISAGFSKAGFSTAGTVITGVSTFCTVAGFTMLTLVGGFELGMTALVTSAL